MKLRPPSWLVLPLASFLILAGAKADAPPPAAGQNYDTAPLADKLAMLRAWARYTAIPTLASNANQADPKFTAVNGMGLELIKLDFSRPIEVEKLTFANPMYWRAAMEVSEGDQLIVAIPVFLFIANGEIDKARRLFRIVKPFARPGTANRLYAEMEPKLELLITDINHEIQGGIALHDQGRYDDAVATYERLLAVCPASAWARYELFTSALYQAGPEAIAAEKKSGARWDAAAPKIYAIDPLYTAQYSGRRGKTMAALKDRVALRALFEKKPSDLGEYFGTYADLALRLEAYAYAAHIYWLGRSGLGLSSTANGPAKSLSADETLVRFLYCLERLGVPGVKENFTGDFAAAFARLDRELEAHRSQ